MNINIDPSITTNPKTLNKTFEKIENMEQLKMIILNLNDYNLLDNTM